jgi:hypothetical protein
VQRAYLLALNDTITKRFCLAGFGLLLLAKVGESAELPLMSNSQTGTRENNY